MYREAQFKKLATPLNNKNRRFFIAALLIYFFAMPMLAAAQASLYISPASGVYRAGERFSILINANSGGETINAATGQLNFNPLFLEVESLGYSQSIFSLWTDEPNYSNAGGVIRFSGGVPNPGYTGAAGAILRVTFKTKSSGQAPLTFVSGSVLANDGKGTNILDSMRGGVFTVVSGAGVTEEKKSAEAATSSVSASGGSYESPSITEWPATLEEGSTITIKGLANPNGKILLYIQKGREDPVIEERFAGADGRFNYNYAKTVSAGFYQIWAKNISSDGQLSGSSEVVTIEVVKPLFFRIGSIAINYVSIIVTLLSLISALIVALFLGWYRVRKWQAARGVELSEAERALHRGFDQLREGLGAYVEYLSDTKSASAVKARAVKTRQDLKAQLTEIEEDIKEEIEEVKT